MNNGCTQVARLLAMLVGMWHSFANANPIQIYTEDFSPYQVSNKQGEVSGLATDIVRQIFTQAGIKFHIQVYPWFRAIHIVDRTENTFIYSLVRTEPREKEFIWVAPLCDLTVSFYRLKSRQDIQINKLDDAKGYVTAVAAGQASEAYLIKQGFRTEHDLIVVASHEQSAAMLPKDRIDLIFGADLFIENIQHAFHMDGEWEKIYSEPQLSKTMYLAANSQTEPTLIAALQASYQVIKPALLSHSECPQG